MFSRTLFDPTNPGTGEYRIAHCTIIGIDVAKDNQGGDPCAEGADAYTIAVPPGVIPDSHPDDTITYFCPVAYTRTPRYNQISCAALGDTMSTKMDFIGATIMHEWLHNDGIGKAALGFHIEDVDGEAGYGPLATRQMRTNKPDQCVENADSYTWLALEVFWTTLCLHKDIPYYKDPSA